MCGGHAVLQWVHRPWGRSSAVFRGAGADIELGDTGCTLTQGGAEAIGAGIAAANNDNFLALGGNSGVGVVALINAVLPGQIFHRGVDAVKVAAFDRKFARDGRAGGYDDGIKRIEVSSGRRDAGDEISANSTHLGEEASDRLDLNTL